MKKTALLAILPVIAISCSSEEAVLSDALVSEAMDSSPPEVVYLKDGKIMKNLSRAEITDDLEPVLSFPNQEALDGCLDALSIDSPLLTRSAIKFISTLIKRA